MSSPVINGGVLLAGVNSSNGLTLATFGSGYAYGSGSLGGTVIRQTVLGVGLNSSGQPVILKLSSTGELVS